MGVCARKPILLVVLTLYLTSKSAGSSETAVLSKEKGSGTVGNSSSAETEGYAHVRQIYTEFEKRLKSIVSSTIKMGMPTLMREVYTRNLSSVCMSSLLQLTGALRQTKLWAFKMIDASGKIPTGFFAGTLTSLGNYEECVGIHIDEQRFKVQGQYCLVEITPPLPKWRPYMSLHLPVPELTNVSSPDTVARFVSNFVHNFYIVSIKTGLCTPASCSHDDIDKLLQILPEKIIDENWKFSVSRCETRTSFEFTVVQLYLMYFFFLLLILVILATLADLCLEKDIAERKNAKGTVFRLLRCFSLRLNMRLICKYAAPEENVSFVYGFMFVSVIWTVSANIFIYVNYDIAANFMDAVKMTMNLIYQVLTSRIYPIQTLYFLSAFASTYKWMKSPEQDLCIWKYVFKVYWRYTPPYMLIILLLMLSPAWGSGPTWMNHMHEIYSNCKDNWWTNMLYINNYVHTDKLCLPNSWFFAVAAQLHITGLLVLIPLKRRPKIALSVNLLLALASLTTVFFANMYYGSPPNEIISFLNKKDRLYYASHTFHHSYYHLATYSAGILAGYLVVTKPTMRISMKLSYFLWTLSGGGAIMILCIINLWSDGVLPSPVISAAYDAASKGIWAAFLLWAAVSCGIERKGICCEVMSWGAFPFLSRLMFAVVIINPTVIDMVLGFKKAHVYLSHFEIFYNLGTLVLCDTVLGYAMYICLESPFLQLTKVVKKTCGIKTFNGAESSTSGTVLRCEEVVSEKTPRWQPGTVVIDKKT